MLQKPSCGDSSEALSRLLAEMVLAGEHYGRRVVHLQPRTRVRAGCASLEDFCMGLSVKVLPSYPGLECIRVDTGAMLRDLVKRLRRH